ncbi:hypothetical protein AF72_02510 [Xylella taiwanensis]|uniref:Uncharacterized protein n=1 Tax=Xylella taiwanensis TaxID=1444770 RepID=Z9JM98_9GAMM|nr:hypothetical protein AF72_02510 [Xylella taiwanensis]
MAPCLEQAIDTQSIERSPVKPVMYMGESDSITLISMLGKKLQDVQSMTTDLLGPHSNHYRLKELSHITMR